ncbi:MAG: hypothetical protein Ct9H90mP30_6210 [Actinomycetota bacterium]|nr:MAG: hypothetical protein Ct9H90mP30_6210 [Actinomycetota bacterium]
MIVLDKRIDEDTIMLVALENGAEDLVDEGEHGDLHATLPTSIV